MSKHLGNYREVDTGLSSVWDALLPGRRKPKHMAESEPEPSTYNDVWAGNADTDKFWSK